jgi:hypothetical protein
MTDFFYASASEATRRQVFEPLGEFRRRGASEAAA